MAKANVQHGSGESSRLKSTELLDLEPNVHLLHLSVLRQLSNKRAGTASTKTRAEVRGGGKKPWRQKGTGRARVGSIRSPLWVGGGVIFGPKPRSYEIHITKKARSTAIAQAIAAKKNELVKLSSIPEAKDKKTKNFLKSIESAGLTKKPVLIVASPSEKNFSEAKLASRNLPDVLLEDCNYVGVYEIMKANTLAITEIALDEIQKRFLKALQKNKKGKSSKPSSKKEAKK